MSQRWTPIVFALIGALTGGLTLLVIIFTNDVVLTPGLLFAAGLGLGIWLARRRSEHKFAAGRALAALFLVALAYPLLVGLLVGTYGVLEILLAMMLGPQPGTLPRPVGYWLSLPIAGVAGALILWVSLRLLPVKPRPTLLPRMVGASLFVCGITIAVDYLLTGGYWLPLQIERRSWANWVILFLMGNSLMFYLYGAGIQGAIIQGSGCDTAAQPVAEV